MATVYKIEIEACSSFISYPADYVKEHIEKALEETLRVKKNGGLDFESLEVKVERK